MQFPIVFFKVQFLFGLNSEIVQKKFIYTFASIPVQKSTGHILIRKFCPKFLVTTGNTNSDATIKKTFNWKSRHFFDRLPCYRKRGDSQTHNNQPCQG